jgi:hypothetical protein
MQLVVQNMEFRIEELRGGFSKLNLFSFFLFGFTQLVLPRLPAIFHSLFAANTNERRCSSSISLCFSQQAIVQFVSTEICEIRI